MEIDNNAPIQPQPVQPSLKPTQPVQPAQIQPIQPQTQAIANSNFAVTDGEYKLGWSWGFWGTGIIYQIAMRSYTALAIYVAIALLPAISVILSSITGATVFVILTPLFSSLSLPLGIYFSIKSKSIAQKTRSWSDAKQFNDTQRAWDKAGKIIFFGLFALAIVVMIVMVFLSVSAAKSRSDAAIQASKANQEAIQAEFDAAQSVTVDDSNTVSDY